MTPPLPGIATTLLLPVSADSDEQVEEEANEEFEGKVEREDGPFPDAKNVAGYDGNLVWGWRKSPRSTRPPSGAQMPIEGS